MRRVTCLGVALSERIHHLRVRWSVRLLLTSLSVLLAAPAFAQVLKPSDVAYQGYYDIQTFGNNTSFMRDLTVRYVNGQQRFLTLTHTGVLQEFVLPGSFGQKITAVMRSWSLPDLKAHNGIWFEQSKNRLWIVSSEDYTTTYTQAHVTLVTLNDNGTVSVIGRWNLANVPEKRVYGGCQPSPVSTGKYVCGWGGYTSLVAQGGGASMGPTMYEIDEPTSLASGGTLAVRTLLDASSSRGVRKTLPVNYFDGGDPRANPPTRPTIAPVVTAQWLSPNAQGQGWMVWGDSYYNTGMLIPGRGFAMVMAGCKGSCWYQSSNLEYDGRQFELHIWDPSTLTQGPLTRPTSMTELQLPFGAGMTSEGGKYKWGGNTATGNISGATYDATTQRIYMAGYPLGSDIYTGRIYVFQLTSGTSQPAPQGDSVAPTVSLTGPSVGAVLTGSVTLAASASDNTSVASVWFTVDGVTVGAEDTTAPYQATWNSAASTAGAHVVQAHARDSAGNTSSSTTISVSITLPASSGSTAPNVEVSAAQCSVTLTANPPDGNGGWTVRFVRNGVTVGSPDSTAPFSQTTTISAGLATFGATWSKSGRSSVSSAPVITSCQ